MNEETILIPDICGGGFIICHWSENHVKVGKVVLIVAPWLDTEKFLKTGMFDFKIDENIVTKTQGMTIFNSIDDSECRQNSVELLKNKIKKY